MSTAISALGPAVGDSESAEGAVFVSSDVSSKVLSWDSAVDALEAAYSLTHFDNTAPRRTVARGKQNWLRTLSAIPPGSRFMGAKVFGLGPGRAVNYAIILIEQSSGIIAAIVDGSSITAIRTAATSAMAIRKLCKQEIGRAHV